MNPVLDIAICAFVLFIVVGSRFNKWPSGQSALFTGKPSDYIDVPRYWAFCFVYIFTYFILTLALYSSPELLNLLPISDEFRATVIKSKTYTVSTIIVIACLAQQRISAYDEQWRQQLHQWARIPRAVEEILQSISQSDNFMPPQRYQNRIKRNLVNGEDGSLWGGAENPYWLNVVKDLENEKKERTINWYYIKCVSLFLMVEDICKGLSLEDMRQKENRLMELGRVIQLSDSSERESLAQKDELDKLSVHFLVCICKHLVKKYPKTDEQFTAFKNLGFDMAHSDYTEVKIIDAIIWCLLVIAFVSTFSAYALLSILDLHIPGDFVTVERFVSWSTGSVVAFCMAVFVGVLVRKLPSRSVRPGPKIYVLTILLSTLASFIYFQIAGELSERSLDLPYARLVLALSFSTLSVVVLKAMEGTSHEWREVFFSSLFHGLSFAGVMAVFQVLVSISFDWQKVNQVGSLAGYLWANELKLLMVAGIGFAKGLFVAWGISYALQEIQRKQLLEALRQSPRVEDVLISRLKAGNNEFRINIRNLSTHGARIHCRERLALGDTIQLEAPAIGKIEGVVRWTQSKLWGSHIAGIAFTDASAKLNEYIRNRYGEYYA